MAPPVRQYSFSSGEISPALYARTDLNRYENGLKTLRNMIVMRQGGVTGRPGTEYVRTSLNGGDPVRLIPFIFNESGDGQSYVVELGDQYARFIQNGANIYSFIYNISGITAANPCVVTLTAGLPADGDIVYINGVRGIVIPPYGGMHQLNNRYFIVSGASGDSFELNDLDGNPIDSSSFGLYSSGGTAGNIYTVPMPYVQADIFDVDYAQSGDILTLTHPDYEIQEIRRTGASSFSVGAQNLQYTGFSVNASASGGGSGSLTYGYYVTTVPPSGAEDPGPVAAVAANIDTPSPSNPVTIIWTPNISQPANSVYNIYLNKGDGSIGFIGTTADLQFIDTGLEPDYTKSPPVLNDFIGTSTDNYPAHVGYVQQRRGFAKTNNNPIGFWLSYTGVFDDFNVETTPTDASPIFGSIAGEQVNAIEAILELKFMLLLTGGAEFYVQGSGSGVVTPSAINASAQSQYGSKSLRPIRCGDVVIFVQALGSQIRDYSFDFAIDGYRGNDITVFANHLFEGYQIEDLTYQKTPDSILAFVRSDGVLLLCTYLRDQQVLAWSKHDFTNGTVENVCAIPENGDYAIYLSIKRTIDGEDVRYIERMSSRIWKDNVNDPPVQNDPINASYVDCFAKYDGRNQSPITMTLSATAGIAAGNYVFTWTDNTGAHSITVIAAGGESITAFLSTVIAAINTEVGSTVYFGSIVDDKVFIRNSTSTFTFEFTNGLQLFGWPFVGMPSAAMAVTAPDYPLAGFYQGVTAYQQDLTLTASAAYFTGSPSFLGREIFLQDEEWIQSQGAKGNQVRLTIRIFVDTTHVLVTPSEAVPASFQATPFLTWVQAAQVLSGLTFLEGQEVSVWADRFVVSSPLNSQISFTVTVTNGSISLDKMYGVIYVGLPMVQDVESLDIENYLGETMLARRKRVAALNVYLYNTRSFFCGSENPDTNLNNTDEDPLFELYEERSGTQQTTYDEPPPLLTDQDYIIVPSRWNKNGRIFCRNVDPVPFSLLAISPQEEDPTPQSGYKRV